MRNISTDTIEEGMFVDINGQQQWITIRGADRRNPVLFTVGGPGAAFTTWAPFFQPWEQYFTLVQWDQPGAGATYALNGDAGLEPCSLQRICTDAIAVAEYACRHLEHEQLVYLGVSGGTVIGLMAMLHKPALFKAYSGCGQFVHWLRQARVSYEMLLAQARAEDDKKGLRELEQIGPPPYTDLDTEIIKAKYACRPTAAEQAALADIEPEVLAGLRSPPADTPASYIAPGIEYSDPVALATRMFDRLRPELYAFDAWQLGTAFEMPVIFIQGELDFYSVTAQVEKYFVEITAPYKQLRLLPGAGHGSLYLRDTLLAALVEELKAIPSD